MTFAAHYNVLNSNEFPLVKSALWAIEHNDDEKIDFFLRDYLNNTVATVNKSIKANSYETIWSVIHNISIDINSKEIITDKYQILGNDYLPENDSLIWRDYSFERSEPIFENFPDNEIYTIPIEILGKDLLEYYASLNFDIGVEFDTTQSKYTYNSSNAAYYINQYTSNTTSYCPGSSILQDKTKYNSYYNNVTNLTGCADCTNYVSQALSYGGLPIDGEWYPNFYSYPWIRVDDLIRYLTNHNRGFESGSLYNLTVGHIVYTPNSHMGMIGGLAPYRYSGHTNDRRLRPASGVYSNFFGIFPIPPE